MPAVGKHCGDCNQVKQLFRIAVPDKRDGRFDGKFTLRKARWVSG
jgi:hypothetical protein